MSSYHHQTSHWTTKTYSHTHTHIHTHTPFFICILDQRVKPGSVARKTNSFKHIARHVTLAYFDGFRFRWMSLLFNPRAVAYTGNVPFARILRRRLHKGHAPRHCLLLCLADSYNGKTALGWTTWKNEFWCITTVTTLMIMMEWL